MGAFREVPEDLKEVLPKPLKVDGWECQRMKDTYIKANYPQITINYGHNHTLTSCTSLSMYITNPNLYSFSHN